MKLFLLSAPSASLLSLMLQCFPSAPVKLDFSPWVSWPCLSAFSAPASCHPTSDSTPMSSFVEILLLFHGKFKYDFLPTDFPTFPDSPNRVFPCSSVNNCNSCLPPLRIPTLSAWSHGPVWACLVPSPYLCSNSLLSTSPPTPQVFHWKVELGWTSRNVILLI